MVVHVLQFQNFRSRGRRIRRIKASLMYVTSSNQSELHMIMSQYHNLVQDRQTIRSLLLANKEVRGRGYQNSIVFRPAKSKPEEVPRISPSLMASHSSPIALVPVPTAKSRNCSQFSQHSLRFIFHIQSSGTILPSVLNQGIRAPREPEAMLLQI